MSFAPERGFTEPHLNDELRSELEQAARQSRSDILHMTTVAGSGHPGGSMSMLEIYLTLYRLAKVDPTNPYRDDRDRIIVSNGHASPGAYAALAAVGFFDIEPCLHGFRQAGSPFEGHVERSVPGIEWDTGNLGQGLSVGVGKALYGRLSGQSFHTWVLMGDGEQQKGQIVESRHTAVKYNLHRLTVFIDLNRRQISGTIDDVMAHAIGDEWQSSGWQVETIDGHDLNALYEACHRAVANTDAPMCYLLDTVMGKGVSFMEHKHQYHGAALNDEQLGDALVELGGLPNRTTELRAKRKLGPPSKFSTSHAPFPRLNPGSATSYDVTAKLDNRSAWGNALLSVAETNVKPDGPAFAVFDCDLAGSVKTAEFAKKYPEHFFQCGVAEHSTAVTAGALSAESALAIWADFGMFGVAEVYNQQRLNDINHSNLKLFCTHTGVNVGEDGKTHQSIDFFALLNSTFGWRVITPADPNQTDRIVRYVLTHPGNYAVMMGRAKIPMIAAEDGSAYFGDGYTYRYGRMEFVRPRGEVALVSAGNMAPYAQSAWEQMGEHRDHVALVVISDWSDVHAEDIHRLGTFRHLVTLEDHNVKTGLGMHLTAVLQDHQFATPVTRLGVKEYASSGTPDDLYRLLGLDPDSVARRLTEICATIEVPA